MAPRTVNVLHVEDDESERLLMTHRLATLAEFDFAVTTAESEDAALASFERGGADLVILDYHLTQGNGLSFLRKLRGRDPIVPVVALSGVATSEIAAELLAAGADDYLSKRGLETEALARSVRNALARAEAWRQRVDVRRKASEVETRLRELARAFADRLGPDFFRELEALEESARQAGLDLGGLERAAGTIAAELDSAAPAATPARVRLRPLMLEIGLRLFGKRREG